MSSKKLRNQAIIFRLKSYLIDKYGGKIKQKIIANMTNIDERKISRLFNEHQNISLNQIIKFYEVYRINLHWLLTGEGQPEENVNLSVIKDPDEIYEIKTGYGFSPKFVFEIRRVINNPELQGQIIQLIRTELGVQKK